MTAEDAAAGAAVLALMTTPTAPRPRRQDPATALAAALRSLVSFEMPVHALAVTRGAASTTSAPRFERAMRDYVAGRWGASVRGLRAARAAGESASDLSLFLGATLLRLGRAEEAFFADRLAYASGAPA